MYVLQEDAVHVSAAMKNLTTYWDSKYGKGNGVGWISRNESQTHDFTHMLAMRESIKNQVALRRLCIMQVL